MRPLITALAASGLVAAAGSVASAQPYYVAGSGLTPSWTPGTNQMSGGPTVYTLSTATTGTPYEEFKITGRTWSDPNWPTGNMRTMPDATGSNTFYFFPGATVDGWSPVNNRVGFADPGGLSIEVAGTLNGWGGGDGFQLNNLGNGLYSNSIVVPTAGNYEFKFRSSGTWNGVIVGTTFGNDSSNIPLTTSNSPQSVTLQLDLANGRWLMGELAPPPVTNQVVFAVDMSSQILLGHFVPGVDSVFVSGGFNGWAGTGPTALVLTNVPTFNGNTNIYYATNVFIAAPGSVGSAYKFTCSDSAFSGSNGYEPRSQDRTFNLLSTSGVLVLPVASFGDVYTSDYLAEDIQVTFTLNMTNAMTSTNSPSANNSPAGSYTAHVFDPATDRVFINGNFLSGGWAGWNPIDLMANQMINEPAGSQLYTFTTTVPRGSSVVLDYKYCMFYAANPSTNSILDNEAPVYQDHVRYIRLTSSGSYNLPMDTFGDQHVEPAFGNLAVRPGAGAGVALSWLGRPGVHVQSSPSLAAGSWVDHLETDGTNWSAGSTSADGVLSATNWPNSGGSQFFRLIRQ